MSKRTLSLAATLFFIVLPALLWAQAPDAVKKYTAFDMRSNGKIYVLVACILIIIIGLLAYMFRLDRKMNRLEKEKH